MAILALSFLRALSFAGAEALLRQEGYVEEACVWLETAPGTRRFLYPYCLYGGGRKLDCIYYAEDCIQTVDAEYTDGRMDWEPQKTEWLRIP